MYGVFFIFLLGRAILSFVTMVKSGLGERDKRKTWRRTRGGRGWRNDIFAGERELNYWRAMECARYSFAALRLMSAASMQRASSRAAMHPSDYDYFSD